MIVMKFTFISNKKIRRQKMTHRAIGIFLSAAMVFNMLPVGGGAVYASEKQAVPNEINAAPVSAMPVPTISKEGGTFAGDTLTLTIGLQNATSGTYKIGNATTETYTSETTLTIGSDMEVGETIKIILTATDGTETDMKEYTFTKVLAVAKMEKEGKITYVDADNLADVFADSGNAGATITLLNNVEREDFLNIKINCTLNLGGCTISSRGLYAGGISTYNGTDVTIQGNGKVISEQSHALVVGERSRWRVAPLPVKENNIVVYMLILEVQVCSSPAKM